MQKLHSIAAILNAVMPSDLKSYLVQKMKNIEKTYHCDTGDSPFCDSLRKAGGILSARQRFGIL